MEKSTFKWAYEGGKCPEFGVDLIEMYSDSDYCTQRFNNYVSEKKLSITTIESALSDYNVNVVGDVIFSGNQNDMRYFCLDTYRNFDGLVSGFGNSRIALICGHYIQTDELIHTKYVSQLVWRSIDTIRFLTLVTGNYYDEPLIQSDVDLIFCILKELEEIIGGKLGVCLPREKYDEPMKLISIDDLFNEYAIRGISL